jgi:hypothetical protein
MMYERTSGISDVSFSLFFSFAEGAGSFGGDTPAVREEGVYDCYE